jgi:hypothetical protein
MIITLPSAAEYVTNFQTVANTTHLTAKHFKSRLNPPQTILPGNFWNGIKTTVFSARKSKQ